MMLNNLIRAKYHWERGEAESALSLLNDLLAEGQDGRAFYWTTAEIEHEMRLPFEIALTNMFLNAGVLLAPFQTAFARLWNALPAQYLILLLHQRGDDAKTQAGIVELLRNAAESGIFTINSLDYDLSGKVVLDPDAYPELVDRLGGRAFLALVERATKDDQWTRSIASNAALIINLFVYAVFHRERPLRGEMVLNRLERISESHEVFLQAFGRHLGTVLSDAGLSASLVSVGMRISEPPNPSESLREFEGAIISRRFEPFVRRYFSFDSDQP